MCQVKNPGSNENSEGRVYITHLRVGNVNKVGLRRRTFFPSSRPRYRIFAIPAISLARLSCLILRAAESVRLFHLKQIAVVFAQILNGGHMMDFGFREDRASVKAVYEHSGTY